MDDTERFDQRRYKHWIEDHVRFSDLDPLGHVNNNAIGQYFENARADLFMKLTPDWPRRPQIFVLARIAIDFRRELHLPAKLRIGSSVMRLGNTSLTLANALFRGDDGIAYCESVSVLIDLKSRKPVPVPDEVRRVYMEFAA
jgi:acyl-CoA thioester hydrolase